MSKWYALGDSVEPLRTPSPCIMVIDPSKSNMAIIISEHSGRDIAQIELSGNDKDFFDKAMDTTDYCITFTKFLEDLTRLINITQVYVEQHIIKSYSNDGKPQSNFMSTTVLTEIRAHILKFALDISQKKAIEVNNKTWKGAILPDGYRGNNYKGSYKWLCELDPKYRNYTDDMTDAICLKAYVFKTYFSTQQIKCVSSERADYEFKATIIDRAQLTGEGYNWFAYNNNFSIEENAIYYLNRTKVPGVCELRNPSIPDLYKYGGELFPDSLPVLLVHR